MNTRDQPTACNTRSKIHNTCRGVNKSYPTTQLRVTKSFGFNKKICHSVNKICHKVDELLYPRVNTRRQSITIKVRLSTRGVRLSNPLQHLVMRNALNYTTMLALDLFKPFFLLHQISSFLNLFQPCSHVIRHWWGGIGWTTPPTSRIISRASGLTGLSGLERKVSLHTSACERSCNRDRNRNCHRKRNIACLEKMCLTQQRTKWY